MRWPPCLLLVLLVVGCSSPAQHAGGLQPGAGSFDGARAMDALREQVLSPGGEIRYRVPGTPGNDEAASLIADRLVSLGWNVSWDRWNASYQCHPTPMHNLVAERLGTSGRLVLLGAHYDTRPIAESDADPSMRAKPIPGANDGASGVALLLELARVMAPTNDTIRLLFFDAEDGGDMGDGCTAWLLGSSHYAENMSAADLARTKAMVLVDLVGDPALRLPRELLTLRGPGRGFQDRIYGIAAGLGYAQFENDTARSFEIEDDHKPFLARGIPAVDLIHLVGDGHHFFPESHHTQHDDLAHVDAASLGAVGRVLETWLREGAESGLNRSRA